MAPKSCKINFINSYGEVENDFCSKIHRALGSITASKDFRDAENMERSFWHSESLIHKLNDMFLLRSLKLPD